MHLTIPLIINTADYIMNRIDPFGVGGIVKMLSWKSYPSLIFWIVAIN